jgi:hypothetical protein
MAGEGWQFGIEAMIPMTRATGKGLGVTAQFHVWLDYFFPNSIGASFLIVMINRPLVGTAAPASALSESAGR